MRDMNVLLKLTYHEQLKDLDEANPEFEDCDGIVLGTNDVVNHQDQIKVAIYGILY